MKNYNLQATAKKMAYTGHSLDEIKKKISGLTYSQDEIKMTLLESEIFILEYQSAVSVKRNAFIYLLVGCLFFTIGIVVTLYTYFNEVQYRILAYGPILAGAWMAKEAYKTYHEPIQQHIPRKRIFSKNKFNRFK